MQYQWRQEAGYRLEIPTLGLGDGALRHNFENSENGIQEDK